MIASWLVDHIPVPIGIALLVVSGLFLVGGGIYVYMWWYDMTIEGSMRDLARGFIERRVRRIKP